MPRFMLYQQWPPIALPATGEDQQYSANMVPCGEIEAPDAATAIREAKQLRPFKGWRQPWLMAHPVVKELPIFPMTEE